MKNLLLSLWGALIGCVVVGSLSPAASPVVAAIGSFHVNDKVEHFTAYLALALLPLLGFEKRRHGIRAGLSMLLLGVFLEAGQHFSPGRAVELGDAVANGLGVVCGILLGIRARAGRPPAPCLGDNRLLDP